MTMALDEQIKTYDLYLSMRLAPMTLQSCYHLIRRYVIKSQLEEPPKKTVLKAALFPF